jgi:hypothetical protein
MSDDVEGVISEEGFGRRTFLRRLAVGSAFAVPVVSSFSMAGINAVTAHAAQSNGLIGNSNGTVGNCNQTISTSNSTIGTSNQYGNPGPTIGSANQYGGGGGGGGGIFGLIHEIRKLLISQRPF